MTTIEIADGLDTALDRAARDLNSGANDLGTLAMLLLASFGREHQNEALRYVVDETIGGLIAANFLLDETKTESYTVQAEVAYSLTYAIAKQGRQLAALRELVADCIRRRAEALAVLAAVPEVPADPWAAEPVTEQGALFPSAPRANEHMRDPN